MSIRRLRTISQDDARPEPAQDLGEEFEQSYREYREMMREAVTATTSATRVSLWRRVINAPLQMVWPVLILLFLVICSAAIQFVLPKLSAPKVNLNFPVPRQADTSSMAIILNVNDRLQRQLDAANTLIAIRKGERRLVGSKARVQFEPGVTISGTGREVDVTGTVRSISFIPASAANFDKNLLPQKTSGRNSVPANALPSTKDIGLDLGDRADPPKKLLGTFDGKSYWYDPTNATITATQAYYQGSSIMFGGGHSDVIDSRSIDWRSFTAEKAK